MKFIEPRAEFVATNVKENVIGFLANCARTCYQSYDKSTPESDLKLIKGIIKSGHHSVLEHLTITMRLVTSRMVTHELVRHRLASYSERSTRYCDSKDLQIVKPCWMQVDDVYDLNSQIRQNFLVYKALFEHIERAYNMLLDNGCTKENASSILPNDTATEIVVTANAREWRHIFEVRLAQNARPEIRQVMQLAKDEMLKIDGMDIILEGV